MDNNYTFNNINARKSSLMEAAFLLAVERGIDKVTIVDIVEKAKTSRVTFYSYFDTMFDIFWEIHRYIMDEMYNYFKQKLKGNNAVDKINYMLDLHRDFFKEHFDNIKFTIFFDCYHNHLSKEENYLDFIIYADLYYQLINEGLDDGSIKDGEEYRRKLTIQINAIWAIMQRLAIRKDHIEIETSYEAETILDGIIESAKLILNNNF